MPRVEDWDAERQIPLRVDSEGARVSEGKPGHCWMLYSASQKRTLAVADLPMSAVWSYRNLLECG